MVVVSSNLPTSAETTTDSVTFEASTVYYTERGIRKSAVANLHLGYAITSNYSAYAHVHVVRSTVLVVADL